MVADSNGVLVRDTSVLNNNLYYYVSRDIKTLTQTRAHSSVTLPSVPAWPLHAHERIRDDGKWKERLHTARVQALTECIERARDEERLQDAAVFEIELAAEACSLCAAN